MAQPIGTRSWAPLVIIAMLLVPGQPTPLRAEPTSAQRAWALAATALLTESNGERHDLLAGEVLTRMHVDGVKRLLKDWWGVTDQASLVGAFRSLAESGHRARFAAMGARLAAMTSEDRKKLDAQRRRDFRLDQTVAVVELHYAPLGQTGILGWDLTRFLSLCRWGYAAGYLTEREAWDTMIPVAGILRHSFKSWRELGENYMIGRQFWDPDEHVQSGYSYREAMDRLLADPDSPWNRVPWSVDFGPPPALPGR